MSLINQVLKDIDKRSANEQAGSPLDGNVQRVERAESGGPPRVVFLAAVLVLVLAGAGGAWWWFGRSASTAAPSVPQVTAVPSAPAPQPVTEDAAPQIWQDESPAWVEPPVADAAPPATPPMERDMALPPASPDRPPLAAAGQVSKNVSTTQEANNLLRRARAAFSANRLSEGQRLLVEALQRDPYNHAARDLQAQVLIELGRETEARTLLDAGVALAPGRVEFVLPLAHLKLRAGEEPAALALLEAAAPVLDADPQAHAFLAALLQRAGRHAEAVNNYVIALRRFPNNAQWLVGLGVSLEAQGTRQAAMEAYQAALDTRTLSPALAEYALRQLTALERAR